MKNAVNHYTNEISSIRAGRATPGMLDNIIVEDNGFKVYLSTIATILVKEPHLLSVMIYESEKLNVTVKALEVNLKLKLKYLLNT